MAYNIVSNYKIISEFKKSRYFKINLGISNYTEKNHDKVLNDKDKFAYFYNSMYKTTIFGQGSVGDIRFYVDHYIREDVMAFYYNNEEFIFPFDKAMCAEKGIDFLLGHFIKKIEIDYEDRIKEAELKKVEPKKPGNEQLIKVNPGSVTYADLQAYMDKKNKDRYSTPQNKKDDPS
jgi:hypothetical protein